MRAEHRAVCTAAKDSYLDSIGSYPEIDPTITPTITPAITPIKIAIPYQRYPKIAIMIAIFGGASLKIAIAGVAS